MTLEELLKENGLTEEAVKTVLSAMKENGIYTSTMEGVDEKYADLQEQLKQYDGKTIDDGSKDARIAQLEADLTSARQDQALERALHEAGFKDTDYIGYKIRTGNELKLEDDGKSIAGLKDIIEEAKKQYSSFLESDQPLAAGVPPTAKKLDPKTWNKENPGLAAEPASLKEALAMKYAESHE